MSLSEYMCACAQGIRYPEACVLKSPNPNTPWNLLKHVIVTVIPQSCRGWRREIMRPIAKYDAANLGCRLFYQHTCKYMAHVLIHLAIFLSVYLSIHPSIYLDLPNYLPTYLPTCIDLSI